MSNIKIINATAEDFDIETFSSEPSGTDVSGDHQDGRIVKYLKNVYMWHDNTGDWIKFPNVVDYETFQADLSTQETDRATAVSSLATIDGSLETRLATQETARGNAIDSIELARSQAIESLEAARSTEHANLSSELSSQISTRVSAVDSEQARAESVEAVLSGALVTAISDRQADVSTEKLRAETAEATISGALVTAISDREEDISAEKSRAEAAQAVLSGNISSEASSRASADSSLDTRLGAQEVARSSEYSALTSKLSSDASDRSLAHSTIQGTIDGVDANLDAILLASTSNLNQFSEIVSYINQIDVAHDSQLSAAFSELTSGVASAELARSQEDSALQASIGSATLARSQEDSTLQSSIDSAALARSQEDSNLQASIDSAALARTQEDSVLHSSIVAQTTTRENEYSTIASNISVEVVARASQDTLISQAIVDEASTELVKEGSLEDVLSTMESTLEAVDVALSNELSSQISSQGSANLELSGDFTSQLNSMIAVRSEEDSTLQVGIDSAELARQQQDSVIQSALDIEESVQLSQDVSLEARISIQEDDRADAYSVMNSNLDAAELARSQQDSVLTSALAVETGRVSAILADASIHNGETLDTFVELVSFLTEVDTESDDALDSYVSSIDSSIAAENSELLAMRDEQSVELSSQISARGSALDSLESRSESAEASIESNISALESFENARHMTINFSSATSLTVATADLPTGFNAGNGMVQVFQEVSSGTYRHLVAPSTFNPSTGEMTFDLGVTAKTGFAVFYSFAGDDQATGGFEIPGSSSSSSTSFPQFELTGVDVSNFTTTPSVASEITLEFSGIGSEKNSTLYNDLSKLYYASGNFGINGYGPAYSYVPGRTFSTSWDSGYNKLTISWTNNSSTFNHTSGNNFNLMFGHGSASSNDAFLYMQIYFDSNNDLDTTKGVGKYLNDGESLIVSPDYILASNGVSAYTSYHFGHESSSGRYFSGPQWQFDLEDSVYINTNGLFMNFGIDLGSSSASKKGWYGSVRLVYNGTQYFINNYASTHRLYSEITGSAVVFTPSNAQASQTYGRTYYENTNGTLNLAYWGRDTSGSISNTTAPAPDNNTDIEFFFAAESIWADSTSVIDTDSRYDMKIVISMSDGTASNMSVKIYRSDASLSSPSWTEVSRGYLSGHNIS